MIIRKLFTSVTILVLSFFVNAKTCELEKTSSIKGVFANKDEFNGKYTYCRFNERDENNASQIFFELYIEGSKNTYIYTGAGYPSVEFSNLGIISIYDKAGGMQSPATIVYLTSQNKKLIEIGKIELIYDVGQVSDYLIQDVHKDTNRINTLLLEEKQDNFIREQPLSYTDTFLLLLPEDTLKDKVDSAWIRKFYSKLKSFYSYDVINLYNQNIFFKNKTLCKKDEKNIFGCKIKNNQLSICYQANEQSLKYKFGKISNIDLQLAQKITDHDKDSDIILFQNANTDYIVNTKEGQEGILIKQNNKIINELKCEYNSIEPMILQGFH